MWASRGEIEAYCYLVQRGKPAALVAIQERHVERALALITQAFGLNAFTEPLAEGWVSLWIYKYPHILDVIKTVPQAPKTVADHWILGKLFGYEEAAIQEFLQLSDANEFGVAALGARG